jgi:hypothetical protein
MAPLTPSSSIAFPTGQDACRPRQTLAGKPPREQQQRRGNSAEGSVAARALKTAGWRRLSLSTSLGSVRITRRTRSSALVTRLRGRSFRTAHRSPELTNTGSPASSSRSLALASRRGCGRVVARNRWIGFDRLHTLRPLASSEPTSFEGVRLAAGCADSAGAFAADTTDYGRIARMTSFAARMMVGGVARQRPPVNPCPRFGAR